MRAEHRVKATFNRGRDCWLLFITCPHCGKTHQHGGGAIKPGAKEPDRSFYGHRWSHCVKRESAWQDGYTLIHQSEMVYPELGY